MFLRYTIDENDLTRKINVKVKEADSFVYAGQTYELCGFTVHSGETGSSGHYRAYHASGVEYDDQGGTSPTLRRISPERLEKLKECGYMYLYKKKCRPSASCPEAVPSGPLASPSTGTVQSSMATDTKPDSIIRPPSPTEVEDRSSVDKNPSSSDQADLSRTGPLNMDIQEPVMNTPSKRVVTKRLLSSTSTSHSSPSSEASLSSSKTAPSPAKRWKQAVEDGAIAQPNPVAEMEEILNPPKVFFYDNKFRTFLIFLIRILKLSCMMEIKQMCSLSTWRIRQLGRGTSRPFLC